MNHTPDKGISARSPIVGIFGHIDHGKSTLLDYIRKTNIVAREVGGITQHISAYEVAREGEGGAEKSITFLDTPGHEAFQAMRSRGAKIADIAVLVVSAEDGVKPQTIEALKAIIETKTPYVVAINKIDKPGANIEKTKQSLLEAGIYIEGYGGSIPAVPISAKTGDGVPALLDMILLLAELELLSGSRDVPASGFVVEASLDNKKGVIATLIIKNGSLKKGEFVLSGLSFAPVRIMENFLGETITEASFSSPVRIIGWTGVPQAGDQFETVSTKREAEEKIAEAREKSKITPSPASGATEGVVFIPVVIKADMLGSVEAIIHELKKIETDTVKIKIVSSGAGTITEQDVKSLSGIEGGMVLGFSVKIDASAQELASRQSVAIEMFDIIYKLSEKMTEVVSTRTPKVSVEEIRGTLKVLKLFSKTKDKQVIGGRVEGGVISLKDRLRIIRRDAEIGIGTIEELQMQKAKAREVSEGNECGLMVESKIEIAPGDKLEAFMVVIK